MARFIALCVLMLVASAMAASADRDATITVRPDAVIGEVNPLVFGNNMLAYQNSSEIYGNRGSGIWDPEKRCPVPEYVELSRLAGVTVHRWPGGCGAHNYNWKLTVGPVQERPNQQFGLPEFLAFCEATDAVPLLTLAVYWGDENDAADIVEYLNAPNDGSNPNGGNNWAAVRAADGHPEPYGVVWFEYGNESYHGEHKTGDRPNPRIVTPKQYAQQYLAYQAAMKAVDPAIQLGGLLQNGMWDWNREVLNGCGKQMDFAIEHTYTPGHQGDVDESQNRPYMQAALACDARIQRTYDSLLGLIEEITGRTDLKLAITEYNGWFVQAKPVPYRQALANALRNAEHLRVMLQPESQILMANFWQFCNEYWGMATGYTDKGQAPYKQANFYAFELYAQHFGDTLIQADVQCETWGFDGAAGVQARKGEAAEFKLWEENLLPADYVWEAREPTPGIKQTIEGKIAMAEFPGEDVNYYFPRVAIPAEPNMGYRVIGSVKTENLEAARGAGFQVGDARGWTNTQSCTVEGNVRGTQDWTRVESNYLTLADTTEIEILARRLEGTGPVAGKAWFRLDSVQKFRPANAGPVPDLGVNCAKRDDGAITLMIVNKNIDEDVPVRINPGKGDVKADAAKAWLLTGPEPWSTNVDDPGNIGVSEAKVDVRDGAYYLVMPACSMAAVEIAP